MANGNPHYFVQHLPVNQYWRLFTHFRDTIAYLDTETTGLENWCNEITTIALYDGQTVDTYVKGRNLNDFVHDIQRFKIIVTYNGRCFDVPFIERYFRIKLDQVHIDLRFVLKSLGYSGGLKGCERQLEIDRGELSDVDGFYAVVLRETYKSTGHQKSLEMLFVLPPSEMF
ncbi:MAG: ribonuclease H-like domain-containing protein [Deltaproteobacteria bacterium]|nr:ribonuclease H-like domain-containing protein [Deltaproteobacteria bacterium]